MQEQFKFTTGVIGYPIAFVLILWIIFWFEIRFNVNLNSHGIYPKKLSGLQGVLFSPFIHSGIKHLYSNTIPLFVLSTVIPYGLSNPLELLIISVIVPFGSILYALSLSRPTT